MNVRRRFGERLTVGVGRHLYRTVQTMENYETAFHAPILSNGNNYPTRLEKGAEEALARANRVWKELLAGYEGSVLDVAVAETLVKYVKRRKAEGKAAMNRRGTM